MRINQFICILTVTVFALVACTDPSEKPVKTMTTTPADTLHFQNGYSDVNGLHMYYEIYGQGKPLIPVHGGGSTIQTSFEKIIPLLAVNRKVIAIELQAHGRTNDRNADLTFEQDADDIAVFMQNLGIAKADLFGFSNGGTTLLQLAIRHPERIDKMILGSALAKRNGVIEGFWGFMEQAKLEHMPEQLKAGYLKVAPDSSGLQMMHDRDAKRMIHFKDIPDEQLTAIKIPTLIINGDKDVITPEHALALHRMISNSELAIIPGGHGEYMGEVTTLKPGFKESELVVPLIEKFLNSH
jgi:pimeloyl-ACP methyl ester carboxylesterase